MKKVLQLVFFLLFTLTCAQGLAAIPQLLNYQGNVVDGSGIAVDGTGYFKFAIVNQAGDSAYWINSGSIMDGSEPPNAIAIPVNEGVFSVKLGDTNLSNMAALNQSVFDNDTLYLRVWFSTDNLNFERFTSDIQILSTGFAFKAAVADTVLDSAVNSASIENNSISNEDISGSAAIDAAKINTLGLDADTLDGYNSSEFSLSSHNHDSAYSSITHTHNIYSLTTHNHDSQYSLLSHDHYGVYSLISHGHNYAGSSSDGGAANDLSCTECVSGGEIVSDSVDATQIATDAIGSSELANGSVDGQHLVTGAVSIHPSAFHAVDDTCNNAIDFPYFYFTSGTSCSAIAPVFLPDGAAIYSATCYFYDNSNQHAVSNWTLYAHDHTVAGGANIYASVSDPTTTADMSTTAVTSSDTAPGIIINNDIYNYAIKVTMTSTVGLTNAARILGCKVNYN